MIRRFEIKGGRYKYQLSKGGHGSRPDSGSGSPAHAFLAAVDEIVASAANLLSSLETNAPPKNRAEEAAKASARVFQRFPN
jgi:hypothetical protein